MNRLSARERLLIFIVAGILFAVGNLTLFSSLLNRHTRIKADLAQKQSEIKLMKALLTESEPTAARNAWLVANQPPLTNSLQAGAKFLEEIKETARANEVLLEHPDLGNLEVKAAYRSVTVQVTAKSSWAGLIKFLHSMQSPERFIVVKIENLQVDPGNASRMACKFTIAKWYAL